MKGQIKTQGLRTAVLLFFSFLLIFGGCSENSSERTPKTHVIQIRSMKFNPSSIFVHKGDTVKWINKDIVQHEITNDNDHAWTSGPLKKDQEWTTVVEENLHYFCSIHVVMKGRVTVEK